MEVRSAAEDGRIAGGRCLAAALRSGIDRDEASVFFRCAARYYGKMERPAGMAFGQALPHALSSGAMVGRVLGLS